MWGLGVQTAVPQKPDEIEFGLGELEKGLNNESRLWEEVERDEIDVLVSMGYIIYPIDTRTSISSRPMDKS